MMWTMTRESDRFIIDPVLHHGKEYAVEVFDNHLPHTYHHSRLPELLRTKELELPDIALMTTLLFDAYRHRSGRYRENIRAFKAHVKNKLNDHQLLLNTRTLQAGTDIVTHDFGTRRSFVTLGSDNHSLHCRDEEEVHAAYRWLSGRNPLLSNERVNQPWDRLVSLYHYEGCIDVRARSHWSYTYAVLPVRLH
jgi:hypothetical protein